MRGGVPVLRRQAQSVTGQALRQCARDLLAHSTTPAPGGAAVQDAAEKVPVVRMVAQTESGCHRRAETTATLLDGDTDGLGFDDGTVEGRQGFGRYR